MKGLLLVLATLLWAPSAHAQSGALNRPPVGSRPESGGRCGIDFMGPCLPDPAPVISTLAKPPKVDAFSRTAFDEMGFAGGDPLVQSFLFADASGKGEGGITAHADTAAAAPPRDAVKSSAAKRINDDVGDGSAAPRPDTLHPGSRMDPVHTQPLPVPSGQTLVAVVAPRSATGQLNWHAIKAAAAPAFALEEEVVNYNSGLWDRAPVRPLTRGPQN